MRGQQPHFFLEGQLLLLFVAYPKPAQIKVPQPTPNLPRTPSRIPCRTISGKDGALRSQTDFADLLQLLAKRSMWRQHFGRSRGQKMFQPLFWGHVDRF